MQRHRYFVKLAYDGTLYHGWQVQKTANSVQETITRALQVRLKHEDISLVGCGRTDTGVHALEFFAHFDLVDSVSQLELDDLTFRLNKQLPKDIVIYRMNPVPPGMHARFSAVSRTYKYFLHTEKDPFLNAYSYFLFGDLNMDLMNKASALLLKYEDFTSFARLHSKSETNICNIQEAGWKKDGHKIVFTITADRFLRNMVRAIVGTILDLGRDKISLDDFKEIVEVKDRSKAGKSAAARGLFLVQVAYPDEPIGQ